MANLTVTKVARLSLLGLVAALASWLHAQAFIGTWAKKTDASGAGAMTMTVEACCAGGRRITYHIPGNNMVLTVETHLDGQDAPVVVGGKPSGETMAIRLIDARHATAVLKMNGKAFGTSQGTISADGKVLSVQVDYTSSVGGQPVGKQTETWIRK
jgi:hypothetical protein